jgi:FkbM family methyltransferase
VRRQLSNLWHFGRLRTNSSTPRAKKPTFLRSNPHLEIRNLLDFVHAHYAKPGDDFFFVQVGAFDGITADPIHHLVKSEGWRGVLVEPQIEAFELLQKNYSGVAGLQFFNVAIGPENGEITLYTRPGGVVQAASLKRHLMMKPGRRGRELQSRTVACWTFQRLLDEAQAPAHIDLLQIDAEGFDYQIIRSVDLARVRPAIIHYEHMVLSQPERNACLELLARHGYRFLLEDNDTIAYRPPQRESVVPRSQAA